jgi:hypothetical protein
MPYQIIGDDGRLASGDDATATILISGYDDGSMAPETFVGAAMPLLNRGQLSRQPAAALSQRLNLANLRFRPQFGPQNVTGNAQVAMAQPGPVREIVQGLDSSTLIAAGATQAIVVNASMIFRPTRLMIGPTVAPVFAIEDLRVAADSLFLSSGAVPAEVFLPNAVGASALKRRTAQPGTPLTLIVSNIDGAPHRFRGAIFGEASDVSSC